MTPFQSDALNRLVSRELDQGETVLWSAERCRATSDMLMLYGFSLFFGLCVLGMLFVSPLGEVHLSVILSAGIFGIFSLFFIFGLIFALAIPSFCLLRANRFAYVVTDKRLLILNDLLIPITRSMTPEEIEFVTLSENLERGSILLCNPRHIYFDVFGSSQVWRLLMPRKIMNAPNAKAALKPLNALLQIKREQEAKKPKLNQGLFKPMEW